MSNFKIKLHKMISISSIRLFIKKDSTMMHRVSKIMTWNQQLESLRILIHPAKKNKLWWWKIKKNTEL